MFEKMRAKNAAQRLFEEAVYEQVATEIENGIQKKGLWAKAIANSDGEEAKAKALYIAYRAQALLDEAVLASHMQEERANVEKPSTTMPQDEPQKKEVAPTPEQIKAREEARVVLDCRESLVAKGYTVRTSGYGWVVKDPKGKTHDISSVSSLELFTRNA